MDQWRSGRVIAWTESDGPGRVPPVPSRRLGFAAVAALGVALWGMMTASTVCPEHALVIDAVGSLTMIVGITAIVATFKASAASPFLALAAACGGVTIAAVDAVHEVTRSRVLFVAFSIAAVASAVSAMAAIRVRQWESTVLAEAASPMDVGPLSGSARPASPSVASTTSVVAEDASTIEEHAPQRS